MQIIIVLYGRRTLAMDFLYKKTSHISITGSGFG